jgi:cytochrome c-type biogenesis protein CcsB
MAAVCYVAAAILRRDRLAWSARGTLVFGTVAHAVAIGARWWLAQRPPLSNLYESLILFAWATMVIFLVLDVRTGLRQAGALVCGLSLLLLLYASRLDSTIRPLMPALRSNWLVTHVLVCFIGYAAFAISFVCSILYLAWGERRGAELAAHLDSVAYETVAFGFLFLALGIITGAIWANKAWGRYWGWDPKETWALITWLIYAFYLHMRVVKGWRGRKMAWLSILGFAAVLFTYLGVSYLLRGLHSYAT